MEQMKLKSIIDVEKEELKKLKEELKKLKENVKDIEVEILRRERKLKPMIEEFNEKTKESEMVTRFLKEFKNE